MKNVEMLLIKKPSPMKPVQFGTLYRIPERLLTDLRDPTIIHRDIRFELDDLVMNQDIAHQRETDYFVRNSNEALVDKNNRPIEYVPRGYPSTLNLSLGLIATGDTALQIKTSTRAKMVSDFGVKYEDLDKPGNETAFNAALSEAWALAVERKTDIFSLE